MILDESTAASHVSSLGAAPVASLDGADASVPDDIDDSSDDDTSNEDEVIRDTYTTETIVPGKADIVLVIDTTGSMYPVIDNVKVNLEDFTGRLEENEIDYRIAVIEYKDITVYSEHDSTKILLNSSGSTWSDSAEEIEDILTDIEVDGGGETPETAIDALGAAVNDLQFRDDASKFAILLSDADYKTDNNYGIVNMNDAIRILNANEINTSVVNYLFYVALS